MHKTEKKNRLLGIDLCRGLAAFAVIVLHSGDETWGVPVGYWALKFRTFFYFAVPFFLAVSFFFTTRNVSDKMSLKFLRTKFQRILIPYIVWSLFYVVFGTIFFSITNQFVRLNEWQQDPVGVIFLGNASYHLYFLPLLFSGSLLIFRIKNILKWQKGINILAFLSVFSIVINQIIDLSGNSFRLNPPIAFSSLLNSVALEPIIYQLARFLLVQIAWMLKCLPYICLAIILNYLLVKVHKSIFKRKILLFLFFAIFVFINIFNTRFILGELSSVVGAFSLLLFGICLSNFLKEDSIIKSLGNCSFGIYLIHPILKRAITIILTLAIPKLTSQVTIISMLCFSISTFLISWLVVLVLMQNRQLAKYLFGN